jgi:N-dimethylarginine dimethylaminohydrolase
LLKENKIKVIHIPENSEVRNRQAMNIVTIASRKVIMPAGCPQTKKIYERHGIKIAAEVKIPQLANGGGGLACSTAVLKRETK